jgi:hypothetical protein
VHTFRNHTDRPSHLSSLRCPWASTTNQPKPRACLSAVVATRKGPTPRRHLQSLAHNASARPQFPIGRTTEQEQNKHRQIIRFQRLNSKFKSIRNSCPFEIMIPASLVRTVCSTRRIGKSRAAFKGSSHACCKSCIEGEPSAHAQPSSFSSICSVWTQRAFAPASPGGVCTLATMEWGGAPLRVSRMDN